MNALSLYYTRDPLLRIGACHLTLTIEQRREGPGTLPALPLYPKMLLCVPVLVKYRMVLFHIS